MDRPRNPFASKNGKEFCPTVDPTDLKRAWQLFDYGSKNREPGTAVAVGFDSFKEVCTPGADVENVCYRAMMMQFLFHLVEQCPDEPESKTLAKWLQSPAELDDRLFNVMAEVPLKWIPEGGMQGYPFDVHGLIKQVEEAA